MNDSELTDRYGPIIKVPSPRIGKLEKSHVPRSRHLLTKETAELLKGYMEEARGDLTFARMIHNALPVLWAIDADGQFWISLEEVVEVATVRYLYSLPRGVLLSKGQAKLGHPSLVASNRARIAGELWVMLQDDGKAGWAISNKSGRFGYGDARSEAHLINAAQVLRDFDIEVEIDYANER